MTTNLNEEMARNLEATDQGACLEPSETDRREMLSRSAAVRLIQLRRSSSIAACAVGEGSLCFFSPDEFAMVDELTELIIPEDDHSPGARGAEVAAYIDRRLGESFEEEPKEMWRTGLRLLDSICEEICGAPFMQATTRQRNVVLMRISENESSPEKPEEHFFNELKSRTVRAYYTSKIGIHQEMEYKGNTYIDEFVGFDAT